VKISELPTNRVRRYRERRRLTLRKLALLSGIDAAHLSRIERGIIRPGGITQERIAAALLVDRDELFPDATGGAA
jgi:HTH-type transcriptional regulator, competence development regulator